jgi:hypothetical protein
MPSFVPRGVSNLLTTRQTSCLDNGGSARRAPNPPIVISKKTNTQELHIRN